MTVPQFTLKGSALDLLDTDDPTPLESVTLTPNTRGQVVSIAGVLYRPEPVTVALDEDGKINGDSGINLLANDPAVDLSEPLQWQVQINTTAGFPRPPKAFWFEAGSDGETLFLGDVSVAPLLGAQGISRGPRGIDDVVYADDAIQFQFRGEPVGDSIPLPTPPWDAIEGKPAVIAAGATQAAARAAIGAGTSNLALGNTGSTAKPGNYAPSGMEITTALGFTPENAGNRNQPNGFAGLDSAGLVPASILPSFVDDVVEYAALANFPATGEGGKIYVDTSTQKVYRWSGSVYVEISPSPGSTDQVAEGSTNLYFTAARAQQALTTQLAGKEDTITAGTIGQYYRGDKTFQTLNKAAVGLGSVDNTSDLGKPVSTATQSALDGKQPLAANLTSLAGKTAPTGDLLGTTDSQIVTNKNLTSGTNTLSPANVGNAFYRQVYSPGAYHFCNSAAVSVTGTQVLSRASASPWIVTTTLTIDRLFAELVVAGSANSVLRLGVWADDGTGKPGVLLLDAGTISTGTGNAGTVATGGALGVYEIACSLTLTPGIYWVGGAAQGTSAPQIRQVSSAAFFGSHVTGSGNVLPTTGANYAGYYQGSANGPLGNFTAPISTSAIPRVGFRVA